jgi:hypothetical protein
MRNSVEARELARAWERAFSKDGGGGARRGRDREGGINEVKVAVRSSRGTALELKGPIAAVFIFQTEGKAKAGDSGGERAPFHRL